MYPMMLATLSTKFGNPLFLPIYNRYGYVISLTDFEKKVDENCRRLRAFLQEKVSMRRNGELKSQVEDDADLLSLFFKNPDIFTDDFIIDELLDFFLAASQTTMSST